MGVFSFTRLQSLSRLRQAQCRPLSYSPLRASGHNRWSKIKHDKGKNDALKARERTRIVDQIILASKLHGPNPNENPQLAFAVTSAKKAQIAKETIEMSIQRGQGKSLSGKPLETVIFEILSPQGVAIIVECETDNSLRSRENIYTLLNKTGGSLANTAFMFERRGRIQFEEQDKIGVDEALEEAIEAGALEVVLDDGRLVVETQPTDLATTAERLQQSLKIAVESTSLIYAPNEDTIVSLTEEQSQELQPWLESFECVYSFHNLYVNAT